MSGGAISDHRYDTGRLCDWAREIRILCEGGAWTEYSEDFQVKCKWLAEMMDDLADCVYVLDKVFSGDSGEERGDKALDEFNHKWFAGAGPSMGNLVDLEVILTNAMCRVKQMQVKCRAEEPDKLSWHGLRGEIPK